MLLFLLGTSGGGVGASLAEAYDVGSAPYYGSFGVHAPVPAGFIGSLSVQNAVHDATGTVYVVETTRISKFDRDGNVLLTWYCGGCYGVDVNQATGNLYVVLQDSNLVQEFTPNGALVRQWGGLGSQDGQFNRPHGVAVDGVTGNVYVWDTGNGRVQVFDANGGFLRKFGQAGPGAGDFSGTPSPGGIAFDAVNRWVYVTDPGRYRVQKFAENGTFLLEWGDPVDITPGHLRWPRSVEVAGNGDVYVTDTDSERIQYFNSNGTYLGQFQGPNDLVKGPFHPRDIAINRLTGEKYVNAAYAFREDKFDATNQYVKSFGGRYVNGTYINSPFGISVSPTTGDVYLVDPGDFLFKRFSKGGAFEKQWGGSNRIDITRPGLVGQGNHSALAVEPNGSVWTGNLSVFYASDPPEPWLTHFDSDGAVIGSFSRKPVTSGYGEVIRDIAVEPVTRDLFVSDGSFNKLKRVSQSGATLIDRTLSGPAGLAFSGGKLYVVDSAAQKIRRYTDQLVEETSFGSPGTGDGQFRFDVTSGIAVRADGHIFVTDGYNHRIQELDAAGNFVAKRGGYGGLPGQFALPEDLALSPSGDLLYVADTFNHRVQMFCLTTTAACDAIVDADGDGLRDYQDDCPAVANPGQADSDGDGLGDACDACPLDASNDADGDGVCGNVDNCPNTPNPDQADRDHNGIGDACDTCVADPLGDADKDNVCGTFDDCPFEPNYSQTDSGGVGTSTPDGIGDACQCGDVSGDGIVDAADVAAFRSFLAQAGTAAPPYPFSRKCKLSAGTAPCSILDVVILEHALAPGGPLGPGIAQSCAAANP